MYEAFWSHWLWPATTAAIGFVFTALVFAQWLQRHKAHQLAWSVGLLFYSVAAVTTAVSERTQHWDPTVYRVYIVLAASLVGFLGLGSLYLMAKRRIWGDVFLGWNVVCLVVFAVGVALAPLDTAELVPGITVGGEPLGPSLSFPRVMSPAISLPGSVFLLGGALVSAWRFSVKREYAYRFWANMLIASGTIVIAGVGARARLGDPTGLYPAEMIASVLLLSGFLLAGTIRKGGRAV